MSSQSKLPAGAGKTGVMVPTGSKATDAGCARHHRHQQANLSGGSPAASGARPASGRPPYRLLTPPLRSDPGHTSHIPLLAGTGTVRDMALTPGGRGNPHQLFVARNVRELAQWWSFMTKEKPVIGAEMDLPPLRGAGKEGLSLTQDKGRILGTRKGMDKGSRESWNGSPY